MERGFKTRCEAMSRSIRAELGLKGADPLHPDQLAAYLDIPIWPVTELGLDSKDLNQLLEIDPDSWSAITISAAGREAIIVHPGHRGGRYSSDVMHELAHILLGHQPGIMFFAGEAGQALRGYNQSAEAEADWLAATLLLPRDALMRLRSMGKPTTETCAAYGVSEQLMNYRLRITGVNKQITRRKRAG